MPRSVSAIECQPRKKWLNIVLDLNGILCQCVDKSQLPKFGQTNTVSSHIFSASVPTRIGPKCVYTRPRLQEFLAELFDIADHVLIWSSMRKNTVEQIVEFLFTGFRTPFDVLGQDSCTKVQTSPRTFLTGLNSSKEIFLKVLRERLFSNPCGSTTFTSDNTLLIDDSPEKSVCNESGNVLFLNTWTRMHTRDNFLMESLAPWLRNLHSNCAPGHLREYVDMNRIGCGPLPVSDPLHSHIVRGMRDSAAKFGFRYELPNIRLVVERERNTM